MADLKQCKTCHKDVASGASNCPHCGQSNPTVSNKEAASGCGCFVVFLLFGLFVWPCGDCGDSDAKQPRADSTEQAPPGPDIHGAWAYSQQFVKRALKSPGTADFGGWLDQTARGRVKVLSDGTFRVSGWVDAQNAFGATVRNNWTIRLRETATGWEALEGPTLTPR